MAPITLNNRRRLCYKLIVVFVYIKGFLLVPSFWQLFNDFWISPYQVQPDSERTTDIKEALNIKLDFSGKLKPFWIMF